MNIVSIKWIDKECTMIKVNDARTMPWPSGIYPAEHIQEWLDAGNEIAPYVPPQLTVEQQRQQAYLDAGITHDVMIEALWEQLVEGRPEKANQLQAKRAEVKARFPKNGG